MDTEKRVFRIVSGSPQAVEQEVNELREHYMPIMWNFATVHQGLIVTALMVSLKLLEKQRQMAMLMAGAQMPNVPRL